MKKSMNGILAAAAASAFGATVLPSTAQPWEYTAEVPVTNFISSGTQTQSERFVAGGDTRVYKTGAGTWMLPYNLLDVYWPFTVKVAGGAVQVGMGADGGTDPGAFTLPASITDKALIWVDAADPQPSHLAGEGSAVTTWYDRREGADVSSPRHFYAKADDKATGGSPAKGTYDGRAGVFFGGVGSGKCMSWYKPGNSLAGYTKGIRHFFAVTGVSNSWGCVYGSLSGDGSSWITDAQTCGNLDANTTKYFWNNNWQSALNSRCFLNGERIDPLKDVQRGVQLLDMNPGDATAMSFHGAASAFFNDRNISGKVGGDYLYEAVCFTNELSEAEISEVRSYLMRKWQIAGLKDVRVKLAPGAELVADASAGATTNGANVVGAGTLAKVGSNELTYRNFGGVAVEGHANGVVDELGGTRFDGEIDVREGSVAMMSQASVAVASGRRVSSAEEFGCVRPVVTVASGASETLVKDGGGDVLVNGIPGGVKTLSVERGLLAVRNVAATHALDAGGTFEVAVPNNSFEEETGEEFADGGMNITTSGAHGWYASDNGAKFVHMSKWTGNCEVMDRTTRSNWGFYSNPPDGDGAMYIANGSYAETDVTIPSSGWYELSFRLGGREGYNRNDLCQALLVGAETVDFGRALYYLGKNNSYSFDKPAGYQKIVLKAHVAAPGAYRLRFSRKPSVTGNTSLVFDDVHLRRVADAAPDTVSIPGGTFETVTLPTDTGLDTIQAFSAAASVAGWTFAAPEGWSDAKPAAGISTPRIVGGYSQQGGWYNDSRGPGHGFAEAFFRAPTTATTTFTASEAGTFRVQADLACYHSMGGSMQLTATVNGDAHDLGTLTPDHKMMRTVQWPVRLALAAGDMVVLTFTFTRTGSNAGMWMDDVCLARRCIPVEGNLVKNGSFEKGRDDQTWVHDNWTIPRGAVLRGYNDSSSEAEINAFGREVVDGNRFVRFQGKSSGGTTPTLMYQDVAFPREGVYRLSFYTHCRLNAGNPANTCPTKWWLEVDGATNLIIRTANDTRGYTEHSADFYVPAAGTFRLGVEPDQASVNSYDAMLDGVSIVHVGDLLPADGFTEDMQISVAEGARLHVCFEGTKPIGRLRLGGKYVHGTIDAKSHPDYISGTGAFVVPTRGMRIIYR